MHLLLQSRFFLLTTWLMLETLDWRMVTASPIEGFLWSWGAALKALVERYVILDYWLNLETSFDNILNVFIYLINYYIIISYIQ